MSFSENDTFSFWENDAVFGNRYSFGNCPRLLILGHMAGPMHRDGANHLGLPSDGAIGPSNSGPVDSQVAPITGPRPVIGPRAQSDSARASASRIPGY